MKKIKHLNILALEDLGTGLSAVGLIKDNVDIVVIDIENKKTRIEDITHDVIEQFQKSIEEMKLNTLECSIEEDNYEEFDLSYKKEHVVCQYIKNSKNAYRGKVISQNCRNARRIINRPVKFSWRAKKTKKYNPK